MADRVLGAITILLASGTTALPQNAELVSLYDTACLHHEPPGPAFRPVSADDIPTDITHQYVGSQQGHYWRRPAPIPAFIAQMRGPGHWGGEEGYCTVGVEGASFEAVATAFAHQFGDRDAISGGRLRPLKLYGMPRIAIRNRESGAFVVVTQRPHGWVSLLTGGAITT